MSNKTNDEKLRILQERLAQIKEKQETPVPSSKQQEKVIEITTPEFETPAKDKKPLYSGRWSKVILIGVVAYGIFYGYNKIDSKSFIPELASSEEVKEEVTSTKIEYNMNLEGNNIAIVNSFEDESSAKAMVNELTVKGFKCDYFFLPNNSNSPEEVYKVFIGPYESLEEVNQWKENVNGEVEILNL
jgi:hypothetical protein